MKASTVTRLNNILNARLPKRLHQDRSHHDIVEYIANDHTFGVVAIISTGDDHARFDGEHDRPELDLRPIMKINDDSPRVVVDRDRLLDIISNLDSKRVEIKFKEDAPVFIKGKIEDCIIESVIAPILEDDEE